MSITAANWGDIFLHWLGGVAFGVVLYTFCPWWVAPLLMAALGFTREALQARGKRKPLWPWTWSGQKWVEALAWPIGASMTDGAMVLVGV